MDNTVNCYKYYKYVFSNQFLREKIFSFVKSKNGKKYQDIDNVNWILGNGYFQLLKDKILRNEDLYHWSPKHLHMLAEHGDLELLKIVDELPGLYYTSTLIDIASTKGHLDVVKWLHYNKAIGCSNYAMDGAATNGHLEIVKFLHQNRSEGCTNVAMDAAAGNCHMDVVRFLHENRSEGCTTEAIDKCCANTDHDKALEMVSWLLDNRCEKVSLRGIAGLGKSGNIKLFDFLKQRKTFREVTLGLFVYSCAMGTDKFLDHVLSDKTLDLGFLISSTQRQTVLAYKAAECNHLGVLKVLHKHFLLDPQMKILDKASRHGLEIVQWLFENGYNEHTKNAFNRVKDLETIKYFHEHSKVGCTKSLADSNYDNLEILKFIFSNRTEGCSKQCFMLCCEEGLLENVKLIAEKYPTAITNHVYFSVAAGGHLPVFQWAESHFGKDYQFSQELLDGVLMEMVSNGRLELFKYICENYKNNPSFSTGLLDCNPSDKLAVLANASLINNHLEVYQYIKRDLHFDEDKMYPFYRIIEAIVKQEFDKVDEYTTNYGKVGTVGKLSHTSVKKLYLVAAKIDNPSIMGLLLMNLPYFDLDWSTYEGREPLIMCLEFSYFDTVKLFLGKHSCEEPIVEELFLQCCEMGQIQILDYLRSLNCQFLQRTKFIEQAVGTSIEFNKLSVYNYLVAKHRYNPVIAKTFFDAYIEVVSRNNYTLFVKSLAEKAQLKSNTLLEAISKSRKSILKYLYSKRQDINWESLKKGPGYNSVIEIIKEELKTSSDQTDNWLDEDENHSLELDKSKQMEKYYKDQEIGLTYLNDYSTYSSLEFNKNGIQIDEESDNVDTDNSHFHQSQSDYSSDSVYSDEDFEEDEEDEYIDEDEYIYEDEYYDDDDDEMDEDEDEDVEINDDDLIYESEDDNEEESEEDNDPAMS
ncbi:hypothetical protein DLAC_07750 [Tieghemostelium lacteum]|uniref:Ankyrin repeat-containing protein n=1 Tax=Tieghemostelium lacteum TaxID=361077 RepID=A0A151ZAB2_TIELA|nr:hypothetical protein DLAC_07750 [Tieghemostelium lacteum]|eukprot:KYQ90879.1 hypothetical protein DLAC_07750 [Tieghemostelium lacteum]